MWTWMKVVVMSEDEELRECIKDEKCREWLNDDWWWRLERELKSDW